MDRGLQEKRSVRCLLRVIVSATVKRVRGIAASSVDPLVIRRFVVKPREEKERDTQEVWDIEPETLAIDASASGKTVREEEEKERDTQEVWDIEPETSSLGDFGAGRTGRSHFAYFNQLGLSRPRDSGFGDSNRF